MDYPSSPRHPRQQVPARTASSSSSSNSSRPQQGNLPTRQFIERLAGTTSPPYESPYSPVNQTNQYLTVPPFQQSATSSRPSTSRAPTAAPMSAYSSASDQSSTYSSPGPQDYQVVTASMMSNPRNLNAVCPSKIYFTSQKYHFPFLEDPCLPDVFEKAQNSMLQSHQHSQYDVLSLAYKSIIIPHRYHI